MATRDLTIRSPSAMRAAWIVPGLMVLGACGSPRLVSLPSRSILVEFEKDYSRQQGPGEIVVSLSYDMRRCRGPLAPGLQATYNGRPMNVSPGQARGWVVDEQCGGPNFRVARTPADDRAGPTTIVIADRSMTITAEYDDLFVPRAARFPDDAVLSPANPASLAWSPSSDRYIDQHGAPAKAFISFLYEGYPTDPNLRKTGDPVSWSALGRIEKGVLSFPVPADAEPGPGTVRIQVAGNRPARRCDGATSCIAWPEERLATIPARVVDAAR